MYHEQMRQAHKVDHSTHTEYRIPYSHGRKVASDRGEDSCIPPFQFCQFYLYMPVNPDLHPEPIVGCCSKCYEMLGAWRISMKEAMSL